MAPRWASRSSACCPAVCGVSRRWSRHSWRGARPTGGVAGEVVGVAASAWRRCDGGGGRARAQAAGVGRLDRLARVGAVTFRVEPPDTDGRRPHRACRRTRRRSADAARARCAVQARPEATPVLRGDRGAGWQRARPPRRWPARLQRRRAPGARAARAAAPGSGRARAGPVRRLPGGSAATDLLTGDQRAALAAVQALGPGRRRVLLRRHRQRQDAGVSRSGAAGAGRGAGSHRAGAGDRAHAADGEPAPRRLRRSGRRAPQRAVRWRARGRLAPAPAGRAPGGGRRPLRDLRAGGEPRHRSSSTKSTRRATRTVRPRATTPARWRRCGPGSRARALVLGSATPSLETMVLGRAAGCRLVRLPERIGARPLPPVELVDLRVAPKVTGTGAVAWSEALDAAIVATLARKEQALLLLNRRGFAAFLQCPDCGEVWQCPRCSISLTVHRRRRDSAATTAGTRSRCRSPAGPAPTRCSRCAASAPSSSSGSWPSAIPTRGSRGWTSTPRAPSGHTSGSWPRSRRGEVDLLLGTQMIAKGLDFPNVTLVGVVDADTGLYLPTFARRSARSSCWPRSRAAPAGGPRADGCWCRPGIRPTTP